MQPAMVALLLGDLDSPGLKERTPVWVSRGGLREGSGVRRAFSGSAGATTGWPSPLVNIIVNTVGYLLDLCDQRFVRGIQLCVFTIMFTRGLELTNMKKG